ncbi:MAG: phosphopyruvate hydratase [Candidatus Taylorbacteria bacterium RIFCSPHIGHO2_01_FULL_46_22b]|uniref:Enolase n=1 Tax=Candidatus Taylorbacteria bacterium RIFCSPHIGHO2_01_FULL_46_22b TaxID=1802301 RepID=A0A1G2M3N1_9BACT|nr:MAG: phosphopyruvate hydratase [Candidatus Taylorbacteria bacterium RIFCSPHIGHO2_01_FULL_46_22b]
MHDIQNIQAREILDSRGNPTVEVDLTLSDGALGRASSPSGASTGVHEAVELRDGGTRFGGKDVTKALHNIETLIRPALVNNTFNQEKVDATLISLDGTENKSKLGANATLAVSLAFAEAAAKSLKLPLWKYIAQEFHTVPRLPTLMMNVLNGGKHATGSVDIQEFMIVPLHQAIAESLRIGSEIYHLLGKLLSEKNYSTLTGDEGGFAPALSSNEEVFELLVTAIIKAGYTSGTGVSIGIDVAASEIFIDGEYKFAREHKTLSSDVLHTLYNSWVTQFPLFSIEDGFAEDAWADFKKLTNQVGGKIKIVGDDLFATNLTRLEKGIREQAANAIIIKPNQIGTVTETARVSIRAKEAGFTRIASHRSGETEDISIVHLCVGLGMECIKAGAPASGERTAKYNELLRIEETFNV